jgi:hypothetical protein
MDDGVHAVRVAKAESKTSQKGNEMIRLRLEDILTRQTVRYNMVFSEKSGFAIDACLKSLNLEMPDSDAFVADPRHFMDRVGFITSEAYADDEFGPQVRIRWISRKKAFQLNPGLKNANIPESDPLLLPAIMGDAPPAGSKRRETPPRYQSFSKEEVEQEMARQAAAVLTSKEHLNQPLNIPDDPDTINLD